MPKATHRVAKVALFRESLSFSLVVFSFASDRLETVGNQHHVQPGAGFAHAAVDRAGTRCNGGAREHDFIFIISNGSEIVILHAESSVLRSETPHSIVGTPITRPTAS